MTVSDDENSRPQTGRGGRVPVAPSMQPAMRLFGGEVARALFDRRVFWLTGIACFVGGAAAVVAEMLSAAIVLITNVAFFADLSLRETSPADNVLGGWVVVVPVLGAIVIGIMARFGSAAIRGHGIPEAMEQVLFNESRIPARVLLLKPLSAVVSIGTGGPFGAEGPIIATGGALGSIVGQLIRVSADERKILLAAGAAAGMSATFGSPVAAVLLAVELLLFEYRPRSLIPVALASVVAAGCRVSWRGSTAAFAAPDLGIPTFPALLGYICIGLVAGLGSVVITKALYRVEDAFARLPIHWMWWPALGAVVVGIMGYVEPRTLGVGYDKIELMIAGSLTGNALALLCICKLVSWLVALGSGTSGGTLAPLFTIGGGLGAAVATALTAVAPSLEVDPRMGALVGMAALFAGASRALLASVVFCFEATRQTSGLLPLLGACSASYLLSGALMRTSIMTEKIARRGRPIPSEYAVDHLQQVLVRDVALRDLVTLDAAATLDEVRRWVRSGSSGSKYHAFPVVDANGRTLGVLTQRELFATQVPPQTLIAAIVVREPVAIRTSATLREGADLMLHEAVGRLLVMEDHRLVGILTRADLIEAHRARVDQATKRHAVRRLGRMARPRH